MKTKSILLASLTLVFAGCGNYQYGVNANRAVQEAHQSLQARHLDVIAKCYERTPDAQIAQCTILAAGAMAQQVAAKPDTIKIATPDEELWAAATNKLLDVGLAGFGIQVASNAFSWANAAASKAPLVVSQPAASVITVPTQVIPAQVVNPIIIGTPLK